MKHTLEEIIQELNAELESGELLVEMEFVEHIRDQLKLACADILRIVKETFAELRNETISALHEVFA